MQKARWRKTCHRVPSVTRWAGMKILVLEMSHFVRDIVRLNLGTLEMGSAGVSRTFFAGLIGIHLEGCRKFPWIIIVPMIIMPVIIMEAI